MSQDPNKMVIIAISPRYAEELRSVLVWHETRQANTPLRVSMCRDLTEEIDDQMLKTKSVVGRVPKYGNPTAAESVANAMAGAAKDAAND